MAVMCMLMAVRNGAEPPAELPAAFAELMEEIEANPKAEAKAEAKAKAKKGAQEEDEDDTFELDKSSYNRLKKLFLQKTEGEETMAPGLALKLFKKSGVEPDDVKSISSLVMKGHKGNVDLNQFVVVMFILKKVKEGAEVPTALPSSLKKFL